MSENFGARLLNLRKNSPKMGTEGTFRYMYDAVPGPRPKRKTYRELLPDFEPDTARAPMGVRAPPFRHSREAKAVSARRERAKAKPAYVIVRSQLASAKKRTNEQQNPCRAELLRGSAGKSRDFAVGDDVVYVRPGGRRVARPTRAVVIAFPDKKAEFVAVDRSVSARRGQLLEHIDVVPRSDVWIP